jgi:hypothetical protein
MRIQGRLRGLRVRRRGLVRLVRGRWVGRFAGSVRGLRCSRAWHGRVLRIFIRQAGAHPLDRAAQFVVEGTTCPGIVAQAVELDQDALGFRLRTVWVVVPDGVRCGGRLTSSRRGACREETRAGRSYGPWLRNRRFSWFCSRSKERRLCGRRSLGRRQHEFGLGRRCSRAGMPRGLRRVGPPRKPGRLRIRSFLRCAKWRRGRQEIQACSGECQPTGSVDESHASHTD